MNVRAADSAHVRTLVEPSHMDELQGSNGPVEALGAGPVTPTASADVRMNYSALVSPLQVVSPAVKRDHFIDIVSSRSSKEVNPHLWQWQAEALDAWHHSGCRGVVEAVTGAGKTLIGITAAFEAFRQGIKVLVLVPTAELQTQWQQKLLETIPQAAVGTLGNGRSDSLRSCDVLVAIINSATRQSVLQEHSQGMLIADECHRYAAATFAKALRSSFKYRLGLTATYQRPDNANELVLDPYFGGVVFQLWYDRALNDGVIAQFDVAFVGVTLTDSERKTYQEASSAVSKLGMSLKTKLELQHAPFEQFMRAVQQLASRKQDPSPVVFMARQYLESVVKRQRILTNAKHKMSVLDGIAPVIAESHGTLVFSQTVDSSTQATELLTRAGIETRAVSSESKPHERRGAMQLFANGIAKVLCAPRILDEGIDVPDSDLAIVLSGSKQPRQTIQRLGRIIRRKSDGRHGRFVVLYAKNTIEDEERNKKQQFGQILPSARRIADFDQTQIRELRRFLRAPAPEMAEPLLEPVEPSLGHPIEDTDLPGKTPPAPDRTSYENGGNEHRDVSSVKVVLRKEIDDEPLELLRGIANPDDLVGLYLKQIGQFPLLRAVQEVEIAKCIEAGMFARHLLDLGQYSTRRERHDLQGVADDGIEALNLMVSSNLRLVVSLAKRYTGRKIAFLDLIQEGNLGLVRAVQKFDFAQGNKFSTYATWWIRQAIERSIADFSNTIRIPVHLVEQFPQYWRCNSDEESRAGCEHDHSKAESALRMQPASLDSYLEMQVDGHYSEKGNSFDDRVATREYFSEDPEAEVINAELLITVSELIDTLSARDAEIIRRRFGWFGGEPQTLDVIGKVFGLTRERIRQIVNNSVRELSIRVEEHPSLNDSEAPSRTAVTSDDPLVIRRLRRERTRNGI